MESALAELVLNETNQDLDDDNEFFNDQGTLAFEQWRNSWHQHHATDEEDLFESDFTSTDEEVNHEEMDAGEEAVNDEEKAARKV